MLIISLLVSLLISIIANIISIFSGISCLRDANNQRAQLEYMLCQLEDKPTNDRYYDTEDLFK